MAEEGITAGTGSAEGQATAGTPGEGTTPVAPEGGEGQSGGSAAQGTTGDAGTGGTTEETFFDPQTVPDELKPAYKSMQRAFSKKMEAIKSNRQKIEAYDAFNADPVGEMQKMAKRMGYNITRADAAAAINDNGAQNWEPKSWEDVLSRAKEVVLAELRGNQEPLLNEVRQLKKNNLENFLDQNAPDWRQYEDDMMTTLRKHPSMVNDPMALYRLSVPPEVLESRATQAALKKLQTKAEGSQIAGKSTTTKHPAGIPDKPLSFDDAVKFAQAELARQGIKPPGA